MQLLDPEQEARKRQNNNPNFPRMLYCYPGFDGMSYRLPGAEVFALQDGKYGTALAADQGEVDLLLESGYFLTPAEARAASVAKKTAIERVAGVAAHEKAVEAARLLLNSGDAPTRAELETKATELGIKFDARTPDRKLGEQIAAALKH